MALAVLAGAGAVVAALVFTATFAPAAYDRARKRAFAVVWALLQGGANKALWRHKKALLGGGDTATPDVRGRVLEIGAGYGSNFTFLAGPAVTSVTAVEPNPFMVPTLRDNAHKAGIRSFEVRTEDLEDARLEPEGYDCVVCTLVLCSVKDQGRALKAVYDCLKPGGTFIFIEHVVATNPLLAAVQHALTPGWRQVGDNCHLNRDTVAALRQQPWVVAVAPAPTRSALLAIMPFIVGKATKAKL